MNAIDRYAKAQMARLEKDLKGAWMAGYDRLDVYLEGHDRTTVPRYDGQERDDPGGYTYVKTGAKPRPSGRGDTRRNSR